MPVAINMRMERSRVKKNDLRCFHRVMLRKIDLKLISFIDIECPRSSIDLDNPPLKIIGHFVLETDWRVSLPLGKFLLKSIASDLAQSLARTSR